MNEPQNRTRYLNSLEIQKRLSHAKNYNDWLFDEVKEYLGNNLLEIGCAIGNFTRKIVNRNSVCVVDIEDDYIGEIKANFKEHDNLRVLKYDISSQDISELESFYFDTIMCFNVLEHIEDDKCALKNMYKLLGKGGRLCLIVPAFQCIYGEMDRTDGHYRRYKKAVLINILEDTGFKIIKSKYINILGFFGWWFNSRILSRKYIPFSQMLMYDRIIPMVRFIESIFKPLFGQSVLIIARK